MHHRRSYELQRVAAQAKRVALLDGQCPALQAEPLKVEAHQLQGLGGAHNGEVGAQLQGAQYAGTVVGLHVLHHQIVGLAAAQGLLQVGGPLVHLALVGSVDDGHLVVHQHVGVIAHALRQVILTLKELQLGIIHADIFYVVGYIHRLELKN